MGVFMAAPGAKPISATLANVSAMSLSLIHICGRFIKLCSSGGSARSHAVLLNRAFETHDLKRVLYGFDMYSYVGAPDETSTPLPMYLYDDNPFNDVYYLLNRDVLFDRLKEVYEYSHTTPYAPGEDRRDDLYAWGSLYEYGEEKVLNTLDVCLLYTSRCV